jgi:hypothetical protein
MFIWVRTAIPWSSSQFVVFIDPSLVPSSISVSYTVCSQGNLAGSLRPDGCPGWLGHAEVGGIDKDLVSLTGLLKFPLAKKLQQAPSHFAFWVEWIPLFRFPGKLFFLHHDLAVLYPSFLGDRDSSHKHLSGKAQDFPSDCFACPFGDFHLDYLSRPLDLDFENTFRPDLPVLELHGRMGEPDL